MKGEQFMQISSIGNSFAKMSSGYKINKAADDASGLAISQRLETSQRTTNVETENAKSKISKNSIEDGKFSQVSDYLQDIRQNLIKKENSLLSNSDKNDVQNVNDKLYEGLKNTLDEDTFKNLGLDNLDINDIESVNKAMQSVNNVQSKVGTSTNALEHFTNYNSITRENLLSSQSKILDTDIAKEVANLKTRQLIEDFKLQMQKNKIENDKKQNIFI